MNVRICSIFVVFLNLFVLFHQSESIIIPLLIYGAVKGGWFSTNTPSTPSYNHVTPSYKYETTPSYKLVPAYSRRTTTQDYSPYFTDYTMLTTTFKPYVFKFSKDTEDYIKNFNLTSSIEKLKRRFEEENNPLKKQLDHINKTVEKANKINSYKIEDIAKMDSDEYRRTFLTT